MPRTHASISRRGAAHPLVIGCLVVVAIVVFAGVLGTIWLVRNAKSMIVNYGRTVVVTMVNNSKLPDDQKRGVIAHVDRLADDYKAGRITDEQMGRVVEAIGESPIFPVAMVMWAEHAYVAPSALSEEEKAKASLDLQRFARGVYEKRIPQEAVNEVMAPLQTVDPNNPDNRQIKERVTTQELQQFLANVDERADQAGVPDEPFEVDFERELGLAIDKALHPEKYPATQPAEAAPPLAMPPPATEGVAADELPLEAEAVPAERP